MRGPAPVDTGQEWCLGLAGAGWLAGCPCLQGTLAQDGQPALGALSIPSSVYWRQRSWAGIACDNGRAGTYRGAASMAQPALEHQAGTREHLFAEYFMIQENAPDIKGRHRLHGTGILGKPHQCTELGLQRQGRQFLRLCLSGSRMKGFVSLLCFPNGRGSYFAGQGVSR